ncbi:DUF6950 family protein [Paenirhodobacter enshiensis]|uniref:DUF6950 domain-containing protein n=1 Tax=Paenirhodobacter enshiensis TaxID=1105367 RepID=A0A086XQM2_9RHOB|nr:hypothetical protein [Paenirhodobacter enshiensis]KFI24322.1 hypothetical protein CG50_10760 [Paenirhodobacter enshiensis]
MVQEMKRLPDWRARLAAEMDRQRRLSFSWGEQDCALGLAGGAVLAMTGVDLTADWRGRYGTAGEAAEALHAAGFQSLSDAVAEVLPERTNLLSAAVGDIGVIRSDGILGEALCIVDVSGLIVMTEHGHGRRARGDMIRAFRVG